MNPRVGLGKGNACKACTNGVYRKYTIRRFEKLINRVPKVFKEYGSYNKRLESWFQELRPLMTTPVKDLPDSPAKLQIQKYVQNAHQKIVSDCDLNPRFLLTF